MDSETSTTTCAAGSPGTIKSRHHRAVLAVQGGDHDGVGDVECGEQAGDPVAGVVVAAPFGHPHGFLRRIVI